LEEVNIKTKLIGYSIVAIFFLILFLPPIYALNTFNKNTEDRVLISFNSVLQISYDTKDTEQVIEPFETKNIDLFIDYMVIPVDRLLHRLILQSYLDESVTIDVEIDTESIPEYVSASITPNQVSVNISQELTRAKEQLILTVTVDDNAPAFFNFQIEIKASVPEVIGRFGFTKIKGAEASELIFLQPGYLNIINISEPKGNYVEIGLADIAKFPIEITNQGNAPTQINFEVLDDPEGWSVKIQEAIILPSGLEEQDASKTVVLTLSPPTGFGYYNERHTIRVNITSSYYRNPGLKGQSYTLTFTVDLRGGLEQVIILILVILVIIIIISIIVYKYYKSKFKKAKKM
jgi:hypothetical protein